MPDERNPHIVLVGLPGSGKSTVGRRVADLIQRPFIDFDTEIERREGMSVSSIFAAAGEQIFRRLEADLTAELASASPAVLAPGGGWVTRSATVSLIRPPARLVWLKVSPAAASQRLGRNQTHRPLLMNGDPVDILTRLAGEREAAYASADAAVDTEVLAMQEVVTQVAQLASLWGLSVG